MKIRYPVIVSIVLFVLLQIVSDIFGAGTLGLIVSILWFLSLLWVAYAVIAKICRTIYRAIKNKTNRPEKSPLEP